MNGWKNKGKDKLEELKTAAKAAWDAWELADAEAYATKVVADAWHAYELAAEAGSTASAAWDAYAAAYQAELKKKEEKTND